MGVEGVSGFEGRRGTGVKRTKPVALEWPNFPLYFISAD